MEKAQEIIASQNFCSAHAESTDLDDLKESSDQCVVSFHADLPLPLQQAMKGFIEQYPNWDQYRLIQAALAGFLVQNGVDSRPITRLYVGNMFGNEAFNN